MPQGYDDDYDGIPNTADDIAIRKAMQMAGSGGMGRMLSNAMPGMSYPTPMSQNKDWMDEPSRTNPETSPVPPVPPNPYPGGRDAVRDDVPRTSFHPKDDTEPYYDYTGPAWGMNATPETRDMMRDVSNMPGADDYLGSDSSYQAMEGFLSTPVGQTLYDVWKKTGDSSEFMAMLGKYTEENQSLPTDLLFPE